MSCITASTLVLNKGENALGISQFQTGISSFSFVQITTCYRQYLKEYLSPTEDASQICKLQNQNLRVICLMNLDWFTAAEPDLVFHIPLNIIQKSEWLI